MTAAMFDRLTLAAGNSLVSTLVLIVLLIGVVLFIVSYAIYAERKVAAFIQDRVGPNRCGPFGLIQPIADMVKLFFKEDMGPPARADRWLYRLAPAWVVIPALIGLAVVPLGGTIELFGQSVRLQIAEVGVGVLYVVAVSSLGVYGVVLGGWAGGSKYGFLGALRSAAQLLSYEVPLGLALMSVILIAGTLRLETILADQCGTWFGFLPRWYVFTQPFAFVIFLTCVLAESNRLPFDLPEAEQELVGGYHTEYSSMKFGMFFLAEYAHMLTASAVATVLFLGGWSFPGVSGESTVWYWGLIRVGVFLAKISAILFLFIHIRWTLPRFRYDQLMRLAWRGLVPAGLLLLCANAVLLYLNVGPAWFAAANAGVFVAMALLTGLAGGPITGRQRALAAPAGGGES